MTSSRPAASCEPVEAMRCIAVAMLPVLGICCCPASQGQQAQGQHKTYKKQIRKRIAVGNTRAELTPGQHAHARAELVRRITTADGATRAQRLTQPVVVGETRREAGAHLRASRMSARPGTCKGRLYQEAARLAPAHSLSLSVYTTVYLLSMSRPASMGLPPSFRTLACYITLLVRTPPRLSRAQNGRASAQTTRASEEINAVAMGRAVDSQHRVLLLKAFDLAQLHLRLVGLHRSTQRCLCVGPASFAPCLLPAISLRTFAALCFPCSFACRNAASNPRACSRPSLHPRSAKRSPTRL
jgi:hypothetical protein